MSDFTITAQERNQYGKSVNRRARRLDNKIPAVIYGAKEANRHIMLEHNEIERALNNEAFYSHILKIDLNNDSEQVVLKSLQRHPVKPTILHMDFLRVKEGEAIDKSVPIHFVNEDKAAGLKHGGMVVHQLNQVEIRCLPKDLPEYIEVDIQNLELGESLHISDLPQIPGIEYTALAHGDNSYNVSIVTMNEPRDHSVEPGPEEEEAEETEEDDTEE